MVAFGVTTMTPKACNQKQCAITALALSWHHLLYITRVFQRHQGWRPWGAYAFYCFTHLCLQAEEQRGHCARLFGAEVPPFMSRAAEGSHGSIPQKGSSAPAQRRKYSWWIKKMIRRAQEHIYAAKSKYISIFQKLGKKTCRNFAFTYEAGFCLISTRLQ